MSDLLRRRRAMMEKKSDIHKLPLIYFKGLDRRYNTYTDMGNRASTAIDLPIKNGQTMVITVPSDIQAAVGAWREDTKVLELFGGWNLNLRYTPTVDVLAKIVVRRSDNNYITDGEFAGKIDVQIGENIYKS